MDHAVIGVVGASGGLGASTLAVALAQRAARAVGATTCVDAQFRSGGLDVTACVEHLPGLRWSDLVDARGDVDGAGLLARLPAELTTRVLAADGGRLPDAPVSSAVLEALRQACALTVVDLPRESELLPALLRHCNVIVLLAGLTARRLADAAVMARLLVDGETHAGTAEPQLRLVVRGPRRAGDLPEELAAHLGVMLAAVWSDDSRLASGAERGRSPGTYGGSLARLCDRLLVDVLPGWSGRPERHAVSVVVR